MEGEETVVDNEQCEGKNEDEHKILGPSTEAKSADPRMELSISETENRNVMDMQEPLKVGENETTVDESSLELNRRIAKSATNSQSQNSTAIDETENGDIIDTDNLEQAGHGALGVLQSDQENDPTQKNSTVFLSGATVDSNTCSGDAVSAAPWDEYKPKLPSKPTESSSTPTKPAGVDDTDGGACAIPSHPGLLSPVAAASAMCQGPSSDSRKPVESVYHIKWIRFKNKPLPIVTQNENGPCPLIAIMNVLFLSEKIKLPSIMQMVTSDQLMEYLGDYIFEHAPKEITDDARLNYEQNMHDAMAVFHKLQTGLDVNVRFTGVSDFEYTPECIVFDLLHIPLYHGWLVDPQDDMTVMAVTNCSYNQLVEKIIVQKSSDKQELVTEALTAEAFLESSMSQLTYHGLSELQSTVKEQEMTVFFRNNHFSTIYKNKNELFLLVTDQGFLTESNVVWESLSNVEGDGHFVDADFRSFQKAEPSSLPISTPSVPPGTDQQVDQDYLVALSLDQEQSTSSAPVSWQDSGLSDHDLAMQLQEEENRRAAAAAGQQGAGPAQQPVAPRAPLGGRSAPQPTTAGGSQRKKDKSDCIII